MVILFSAVPVYYFLVEDLCRSDLIVVHSDIDFFEPLVADSEIKYCIASTEKLCFKGSVDQWNLRKTRQGLSTQMVLKSLADSGNLIFGSRKVEHFGGAIWFL